MIDPVNPIWNATAFLTRYARIDGYAPVERADATAVLDRYVLANAEAIKAKLRKVSLAALAKDQRQRIAKEIFDSYGKDVGITKSAIVKKPITLIHKEITQV